MMNKITILPSLVILLSLIVISTLPVNSFAKDDETEEFKCSSTREYVTTLEYLRRNEDYGLAESQAQKIADEVSQGCTNAAKRFIKGFELMHKVEMGGKVALRVGLALANSTDDISDNFLSVFKKTYLSSQLDLDAKTSLAIARQLSYEFKGNFKAAREDFVKLVDFCSRGVLGMPASRCSAFAVRLIKNSEQFEEPMAKPFIKTFEYLRGQRNIGLSVTQAFKAAEDIVASGPNALDNFSSAYKYALSSKGLKYSAKDAYAFAQRMSKRTVDQRSTKE